MADYEQKPNTGILWHNTDKKYENSPDYSGSYNHEGEQIKLVGWERTSKTGKTFISISKAKEQIVPVVGEIDEDGKININDIPF